jgi:hypothetical protein
MNKGNPMNDQKKPDGDSVISELELEIVCDEQPHSKPQFQAAKSNRKIALLIGGIGGSVVAGGGMLIGLLLLIVVVAASTGGGGGYGGSYGGGYGGASNGIHAGPNGGWVDDRGWGNIHTQGTVDPNGPNSVYSVDGRVLDLPN